MARLWKRNRGDPYEARLEAERRRFGTATALPLRRRGTLVPPEADLQLISASIGPDLSLIALWTTKVDAPAALDSETVEHGVRLPRGRASRPYRAILTWHGGSGADSRGPLWIDDLDLTRPIVQPLPDGGLLVVSARSRLRNGHPEHNAYVYGAHGFVDRSGSVGDGVEDVQVSPTGRIWISYFDEGVVGVPDWADLTPIGEAGLVEFSAMLTPIWRYAPIRGFGPITDCYALNVSDEIVWCCYFPDFPLVRIDPQLGIHGWQNDLRGVVGVITDGRQFGLVGGYPPYGDRFATAQLLGEKLELDQIYRLTRPNGDALPDHVRLMFRGQRLIALVGTDVYALDMDDVQ
ncbi:MAG TPA: hypothetical protein VHO00_13455 [Actinomycetes bacterium]|nr:hypothetical protein [Actinomycetes bacterium]